MHKADAATSMSCDSSRFQTHKYQSTVISSDVHRCIQITHHFTLASQTSHSSTDLSINPKILLAGAALDTVADEICKYVLLGHSSYSYVSSHLLIITYCVLVLCFSINAKIALCHFNGLLSCFGQQ